MTKFAKDPVLHTYEYTYFDDLRTFPSTKKL